MYDNPIKVGECNCQGDLLIVKAINKNSRNFTYIIKCDTCGLNLNLPGLKNFEDCDPNDYEYNWDIHLQEIRRFGWEKCFHDLEYIIPEMSIILGEEIFCFVVLSTNNNSNQKLSWVHQLREKYHDMDKNQLKEWLEKLEQLIKKSDFKGVKEFAIQLLTTKKDKIIFKEKTLYFYDLERLSAELFIQLDINFLTQLEIGKWAQDTREKYENDMDPKAKDILIELEIMAYIKELEKSIEELRDLAIILAQSNVKEFVLN